MATKVKALQMWCKKMAEGYRDVDVKDMTTSWKNGLAFCAIIHRFRPDLIDYDSLSKENIFDNNQLAFDVAEKELGIPAFLDAPDMVAIRVPDKLSIVTYVSQYYNYFHDKPQLGGPGVSKPSTLKRQQTSTPSGPDPKRQSLTPSDGTPNKDRQVSMGDKCSICHKKVYLLERHMADGCLYHRSCFKSSDKSPASKILNKSNVISDKDSDKKSVQNEKSEVPDFWKRRAEAKKAEMKSDDILTDKEKEKDPDHRTNINDDSKDKSVPFWKKSRPDDLKLDSNGNEKQNAQLDKVNKKDNADTIITPQPRARRVVKIGAHIDKKEEEPMDTSNCTISSETSGRGPGNILNKQNITPKSDIKKEEEISEYKNPRARRVVKIGAPKEKKDEEPMDTSISMVSSELNIKDPGNILNKPQAAPRVNNKKVDEISENKAPRARHVVKIVAKKEEDSAVSYKDRSPVQTNRVTSVLTPDTSPPPLPSSAPPPVKFQSPSSPPPLPSNLPPQLPLSNKSSTENIFSSKNRTSPLRPASTPVQISPSQPHKEGISQSRKSSSSILDSKEQKKDNPDKVASLMSPTKKDGKVLGGLLKNLAGIRQKKSSESEDKSPLSPTKGFKSNLATTKEESVKKREVKSCDIDVEKKSERTAKAKSANFVTGKMSVFSKDTAESTISAKSKKETSVLSNDNDDMPAWKKALEERKRNRPKSADLLSETSQVPSWKKNQNQAGRSSPNRPKSMDVLSEKDNEKDDRPAWQIEAEKRMNARKSGFVDPEKSKVEQGHNFNKNNQVNYKRNSNSPLLDTNDKENNKTNMIKQRILPTVPSMDSEEPESEQKKITVDTKFRFSTDFDKKDKEKDIGTPPRPLSVNSFTPSNDHRDPSNRFSSNKKSEAPPRPATPRSSEVRTFGDVKRLTPQEIQKQLMEIDSRLTNLEIRGRTLEDSIRKAQEEEEDEKMMVEWFNLVNEKNELVRSEANLVYISRAQELEDEQEDIDRKIRRLMKKPEILRTDKDKEEEEFLLQRLVDVVNQRSLIVDSQDEDRIRYEEEDRDIASILASKDFCKESPTKKKDGKHDKKKKKKEKKKSM